MSRVIVLTGERGIGKSTICREVVALAQEAEYACGGLVTLCHSDGTRTLLNVSNGERHQLTLGPDQEPAVVQGRFRFDPKVLKWGDTVLARAVPCALLVVDELGPLEIERGKGWASALNVLRGGKFMLALVVVRPELLVQAQLQLPTSATTVLTVTVENRDLLPASLFEMLQREVE